MSHARDVRGLRRYVLMGQILSILMGLAGLISISLFIDPAIMGIASKQQAEYRGNLFFLMVGIGFLCFALLFNGMPLILVVSLLHFE
ncbi:hypothetical protein IQE94_17895 (plasmid) [Synechocystis sp. PCC 7339]|uniref:hypothetical protein n=1 Tax=unclassified Synechocystis TaxID=2640012 RepID=UPI001BAF0C58|nr:MULTISPECIES: hypothetical protein [unclassified Synechocystis]QUS62527.1 hypothetical protein HTZ78_17535 [Synechocystis sp. PCC 7338]UAJ74661.1 hypothetical protein IQE94_17895 [Synechocystis sp. PCC 7339]